jgi:hypothetical protein
VLVVGAGEDVDVIDEEKTGQGEERGRTSMESTRKRRDKERERTGGYWFA